ncbi:MAG: hypothetical protein NC307_03320 [Roseburia sp.]|nr:hypothetical protein [Roseburia sp.]
MRKNNQDLTMIRLVILDYIGGIKEGWKKSQVAETFSFLGIYIWVTLLPGGDAFYDETAQSYRLALWGYGVVVLLIFLGFLISRMYPGQLEKTLHLCPLTETEKKQYVETGYRVRIALPMFLYVLAGVFWQIFGIIPLFCSVATGIWYFLYLACVNIYCLPETTGRDTEPKYPIKWLGAFQAATQILGIGAIVILSDLMVEYSGDIPDKVFCLIPAFLQNLLYVIMREKIYPSIMERAVCYENNN